MVPSAWAAVELRVGHVFAQPGGVARAPVLCTGATNLIAAQFDLVLGSTNVTADDAAPGPALAGHEITSGEPQPGVRRVVIHSPTNDILGSGVWAYVPLTLSTNTPYGLIPLTLTNVLLAYCDGEPVPTVSLIAGSLTCTSAVPQWPVILVHPLSQTIAAGSTLHLSTTADGLAPLSYQWWFNDSPIPGATDPVLQLQTRAFQNAGAYTVIVTNAHGSVTSQVATLSVRLPRPERPTVAGRVVVWGNNQGGVLNVPLDLTNAVAISGSSGDHAVALRSDGTVTAWGFNNYDQCNVPPGLSNVVAVDAGHQLSVALQQDGTVVAWGYGGGVSGYPSEINVPPDLSNAVAIAAGHLHGLALKDDGTVVGWGQDGFGETVPPPGLSNVVAISAGYCFNTVLKSDGTVVVWGKGQSGETNVPAGLTNVTAVASGAFIAVARQADGSVALWGDAGYGTASVSPALLQGCSALSLWIHGLALRPDGTVFSWGQAAAPTNVPAGLSSVVAVSAGNENSYAITTSPGVPGAYPSVLQQPQNQAAPLGATATFTVGSTGSQPLFYQWRFNDVAIPGATNATLPLSNVSQMSVGSYAVVVSNALGTATSSNAILSAVNVAAWGANEYGQCNVPADLTNAVMVEAGLHHSLALRDDGTVVAWGDDTTVGAGLTIVPPGLSSVVAIACGAYFSVALKSDGTVATWPADAAGPVPASLINVVAIAAGGSRSMALKADGTVTMWGLSYNPAAEDPPTGLRNVMGIAVGGYHNLALRENGSVVAWGDPIWGALGVPADLTNAVAVAAGCNHGLALRSDGTAVSWGPPYSYVDAARGIPPGLSNVIGVDSLWTHNLFLKADCTVVGSGSYGNGQTTPPAGLPSVAAIAAGGYHSLGVVGPVRPSIPRLAMRRTVYPGAPVVLQAAAIGSLPMRYQWFFNDTNRLAGATNASLSLRSVVVQEAGTYSVVVSNSVGAVTSVVASLTLAQPLMFSVVGRGGVGKSPDLAVYDIGQLVTLTATPGRWYSFQRWSDGVTNNPRLITIGLTNAYTAIFTNTVPLEQWVHQQWDKSYGGTGDDSLTSVLRTSDGGFILGGYSASGADGNKTSPALGGGDFWVVRLDANGNRLWDRSFGNSSENFLTDLEETANGGCTFCGYTVASPSYGSYDYYVSRLDAEGNLLWSQVYGSYSQDLAFVIGQTADGGSIVGGQAFYGDGGGTRTDAAYGESDYWVVRLDDQGNQIWDRSFGGSFDDSLQDLQQLPDGGLVLAGFSSSGATGNKTALNWGSWDYWVVRTDAATQRLWDRSFGGTAADELHGVALMNDGGLVLGGDSWSGADGNKTSPNYGSNDFWVVVVDASGSKCWEHTFGGSSVDTLQAVETTRDGGILLGGSSWSGVDGNKTSPNKGSSDFWLVRLDGAGNKLWDYSFGGSGVDELSAVQETPDGGVVLAGTSASPPGGNKTSLNYGSNDFWIVKLSVTEVPVGTPVVFLNNTLAVSNRYTFPQGTLLELTLQSSFEGGTIYYSTDDSEPTLEYAGPIQVTSNLTLRSLAYSADFDQSPECDPVTIEIWPTYPLTAWSEGGGTVSLSSTNSPYLSNTVVRLTATPDTNWSFLHWLGDVGDTNPALDVTMDSAKTVRAVFGTPVFTATNGNGTVAIDLPQTVYPYGSTVRLMASALGTSFFRYWTGPLGSNNVSPLKFVVTNAAPLFTATFGALPPQRFRLTGLVNGSGDLNCSPYQNFYSNGQSVVLTAVPDAGWFFQGWEGDASGSQNPLPVTMNTNKVITARFALTAPPSNAPPSVALTAPSADALFTAPATIQLAASASDSDGAVSRVEFYRDGLWLASVILAPYAFTWTNVPPGNYALTARAVDNQGAAATSSVVAITVSNPPPVVFLVQPTNGSVVFVPTNLPLTVFVSDNGGAVVQVRFLHGGTNLIGVSSNAPFSLVWSNVPAGTYTLTAEAMDDLGATSVSPPVTITVLPPGFTGQGFHFTQLAFTTNEGAGSVTLVVEREPGGPEVVNFATANGSASAARPDYLPVGGTLRFTNGLTLLGITVPLVDNNELDGARAFAVQLTLPGASAPFTSASVVILDDDAQADQSSLAYFLPQTVNPNSRLQLTLDPAYGGWRFPWESTWRPSDGVAAGLIAGQYDVAYKPLSGYWPPPENSFAVLENTLLHRTNAYVLFGQPVLGALSVVIEPPEALGAMWSLAGEPAVLPSGATTNLTPGAYVVVGSTVPGWVTPSPVGVLVVEGQERIVTLRYTLAETWQGSGTVETPRQLRTYANLVSVLNGSDHLPFGWNGQIVSDLGSGSGVVVKDRVVLTAAHVVWDEARGQLAPNLRWFFQRHAGEFEPKPVSPRGVLLFGTYVTVRSNHLAAGGQVGVSTAASRQQDVAVLYFDAPAGRGGSGGYLLSGPETSAWLLSSRNKLLVGYPVSGPEVQPGKIHETLPGNYAFLGDGGGVYHTADVRGYGGNSGGPFYVQHTNNLYYPAAVYLGSAADRSFVRVIDTNVTRLINLAAALAVSEEATNQLDPSFLNVTLSTNTSGTPLRKIYITILPPAAANHGARWSVWDVALSAFVTTNQMASNVWANVLAGRTYRVDFAPAVGLMAPPSYWLTVTGAYDVRITATYQAPPRLEASRAGGIELSAATGRLYQVQRSGRPESGWSNWFEVQPATARTNLAPPTVFTNAPRQFYRVRVVP